MINRLFCASKPLDEEAAHKVLEQQLSLLSSEGALGRIEEITVKLAAQQGKTNPSLEQAWLSIFASDHGFFDDKCQDDELLPTMQRINRICHQSAAISPLINTLGLKSEWIDVGVDAELTDCPDWLDEKIAPATQSLFGQAAMDRSQLLSAMQVGIDAVERAHQAGADIFIGGEVASGNEISALAIASVLSGKTALELISSSGEFVSRAEKRTASEIDDAVALHRKELQSPLYILQYLGGFEIAALAAAYIRCAQLGMTMLIDGFVATVALWLADMISRNDQLVDCDSVETLYRLGKYSVPETMFCLCGTCPRLVEWSFFAQQSAHPAHAEVLDILAAEPLLSWQIKQGEALGALMVLPLLKQACAINNGSNFK
ncbi:nicotinate-nucleotide--dimethylbenzimidazole phosphoribosyltransferase [Thiomicrorhabdus sediminis]|uniref:Nicotinate-nucleotide--dimethylbenzimidazole phosphoribosyltransferase n=1 Tax=Thiomicrorhabdus sediminis TaxID=2580412 RepID=A0A4P9K6C0_9GAMM|nr:nicotinate-nucleotide--dimethylbenzimidazole phosphoribosyltransferase [Thiomicrorhabdus sediminis]QCU89797.1 nicotinate-nucleotide--dimethylbenzimidazole phosphoribosyltransferase [Thiomicrorhabdus sediminis]